tara:strand:- start:1280 stop:1777 length:498 start_codon:yes stop_codon:yes gene_type:complete
MSLTEKPKLKKVSSSSASRARAKNKELSKKGLLTITGFAVALMFLLPYIRMMLTALTPKDELYQIPAEYVPSKLEWSNFVTVWESAPILQFLINTLIIATAATVVGLLVSVLWRITLPLSLPGLITATIFTFITAWNEFVVTLTLTSSIENWLIGGLTRARLSRL